jgi:hypothetical protein
MLTLIFGGSNGMIFAMFSRHFRDFPALILHPEKM